jgi:hypothetical protein
VVDAPAQSRAPGPDTPDGRRAGMNRRGLVVLWTPLAGGLTLAVTACFVVAWLTFDPNDGHFRRHVSDALLQLAVVGLVGGVVAGFVKLAFDRYNDSRAKAEVDRAKRLDFMTRMRGVHNAVAYAQWLIRAHGTAGVYEEQMRELTRTTNALWEIHADLEAAEGLFAPADAGIRHGVRGIIDFLDRLTAEYEPYVGRPDDASVFAPGTRLSAFLERPADADRRLPIEYELAVDASKGKMRELIYGSKGRDRLTSD